MLSSRIQSMLQYSVIIYTFISRQINWSFELFVYWRPCAAEGTTNMNSQSFTLAERLIPATYLQQAAASKKARENLVRILIEQVR